MLLLDEVLQVTPLGILHHDAQLVSGSLVDFLELDNVGVVQHAMQLRLSQGRLSLFGLEVAEVDSLHDVELAFFHALDEVGSPHGSLPQDSYLAVFFTLDDLAGHHTAILHE